MSGLAGSQEYNGVVSDKASIRASESPYLDQKTVEVVGLLPFCFISFPELNQSSHTHR